MRAFRNIRSFDPSRPFAPWLTRIVLNEAIRLANWSQKGGQPGEIPDQVAPTTIEDEVGQSEIKRLIGECIGALPPAMRALITLKYYRSMSDPEIAEVMECPVGTVKSRLAKARSMLRKVCLAHGVDLSLELS